MDKFSNVSMFIGIIIGIRVIIWLIKTLSQWYTNFKYKSKLKKITESLISFDIQKISDEYLKSLNDFQSQKKDLTSVFKLGCKNSKEMTLNDLIRADANARSNKKRKKKFSYYKRY